MPKPQKNDPSEWLKLTDPELGYLLLAQFAAEQARELNLPVERMTVAYLERVRQHVLTQTTDKAKNASLQLALHAVASGDAERAGRLYRQLLLDGATQLVFEQFTSRELRRLEASRSKGGKSAAETRRAQGKVPAILKWAEKFRATGRARQDWAGLIAKQVGVSDGYVRRVLRKNRTNS